MRLFAMERAAGAVLMGLAINTVAFTAQAGIDDYEFQLVQPEVKQSDSATIAVRLIDKRTGEAVPDAVIFAQRADMAPDGMEMMAAPIELLPSSEPGLYLFKADLMMEGGWRLSIGAKVQGETGTVENRLEFRAVP